VTLTTLLTDVWYRLEVIATDSGSLSSSAFIDLFVHDDQPDSLRFTETIYRATASMDLLPGSCLTNVLVADDHSNAMITYQTLGDDAATTNVFRVGRRNGRVCTRSWLPYDIATLLRLAIVATDSSLEPARSAAVAVELNIINNKTSLSRDSFETGFYWVSVDEDVPVGHCLLTVSQLFISKQTILIAVVFTTNTWLARPLGVNRCKKHSLSHRKHKQVRGQMTLPSGNYTSVLHCRSQ